MTTPRKIPASEARKPMQDQAQPGPVADAVAAAAAHEPLPPVSADKVPVPAEAQDDRGPGQRRTRVPFGHQQMHLDFPEREGFKRRLFNDVPGRVQRARDAWWEHVKDPVNGENIFRIVGVAKEGGGLRAFLMEIPIELYEQDKAAQQALIDQFDEAVSRGAVNAKEPGQDGRYVPTKPDGKPRIDIKTSAGVR